MAAQLRHPAAAAAFPRKTCCRPIMKLIQSDCDFARADFSLGTWRIIAPGTDLSSGKDYNECPV